MAGIGDKLGYLDELGNVTIPIQYEYEEIFDKGKARVMLNGGECYRSEREAADGIGSRPLGGLTGEKYFVPHSDDRGTFIPGLVSASCSLRCKRP